MVSGFEKEQSAIDGAVAAPNCLDGVRVLGHSKSNAGPSEVRRESRHAQPRAPPPRCWRLARDADDFEMLRTEGVVENPFYVTNLTRRKGEEAMPTFFALI